jgi:hypothetical protein
MIHFLIFLEHLLLFLFLFFLSEHAFESDVVFILFLCARGAEENFRTITLNKHIFLYWSSIWCVMCQFFSSIPQPVLTGFHWGDTDTYIELQNRVALRDHKIFRTSRFFICICTNRLSSTMVRHSKRRKLICRLREMVRQIKILTCIPTRWRSPARMNKYTRIHIQVAQCRAHNKITMINV